MHAMIGFMRKPDGVSTAEFRDWWLGKHVPHVLAVPGLRHYVVCPADRAFDAGTGGFDPAPAYDGVAMLYFDDEASMREAFSSPKGESDRNHLNEMGIESVIVVGQAIVQRGDIIPG